MKEKISKNIRIFLTTLVIIFLIILGLGTAAIRWFSRDLPSIARLEMVEPSLKTKILAADSTLITELFAQNRILLSDEEIPPQVKNAFLAVEDHRFYKHFGIDIVRIASALWEDISHWSRKEGASTITQQLARDLFLTKEQTFSRKIKEILLAFRIERAYSKQEILSMYLNQIYFGEGSYGIEAASRKFFGKSVRELSLHQIALLAGLQKNPAGYNPFSHPNRALGRRNIVLRAMKNFRVIDHTQLDTLKVKPLDVKKADKSREKFASYFAEFVRLKLKDKFGSPSIYKDGYTVYTTLDPHLQRVAEDSMETFLLQMEKENDFELTRASYLDSVESGADIKPNYIQSGVIALDPRNGHMKVMVGGRSFSEKEFNNATQARRQPGSAFKLFIYITALKNGFSPSDIILDTPIVVEMPNGEVYKPKNFSNKFHGAVSLRHALEKSINVPAIKLLEKIGPPAVVSTAKQMGIESTLKPYLSLALGAQEVTLLELTSAFGVLAAEGVRAEPMAILRIEDRYGRVIEDYREHHEEILSPEISYMITNMLQSVMDEGTGRNARGAGLRIPCAGKTGTTDNFGDGWFIGFTPELVVGVWTGFSHRVISMGKNKTGARVALPIWIDIMKAAYPNNRGPDFRKPENITTAMVCKDSGLLATPYCPNVVKEIFIEGMEPSRHCDIHRISTYDLLEENRDLRKLQE